METKKVNKQDLFEWTKTLELNYHTKTNDDLVNSLSQSATNDFNPVSIKTEKDSFLIDDYVLSLEANPFYQPSMNTTEFKFNDAKTVELANLEVNDHSLTAQLEMLEKMHADHLITTDDYVIQKNELLKSN